MRYKKFKYAKRMIVVPYPGYFGLATTKHSNSKCFMQDQHSMSYTHLEFNA